MTTTVLLLLAIPVAGFAIAIALVLIDAFFGEWKARMRRRNERITREREYRRNYGRNYR